MSSATDSIKFCSLLSCGRINRLLTTPFDVVASVNQADNLSCALKMVPFCFTTNGSMTKPSKSRLRPGLYTPDAVVREYHHSKEDPPRLWATFQQKVAELHHPVHAERAPHLRCVDHGVSTVERARGFFRRIPIPRAFFTPSTAWGADS